MGRSASRAFSDIQDLWMSKPFFMVEEKCKPSAQETFTPFQFLVNALHLSVHVGDGSRHPGQKHFVKDAVIFKKLHNFS